MPPQPAPMDVCAILPMLRAEDAEITVEFLARAVAGNALTALRWLVSNWGAGAGAHLRDPYHPVCVAILDSASPWTKFCEAQGALHMACWRYRMSTGQDGLALAREVISFERGATVADFALRSLAEIAVEDAWLDDLLMESGPEPLPSMPPPTLAERHAAARASKDWLLSWPDMNDLAARLEALLAACKADGAADPRAPVVQAALAGVRAEVGKILRGSTDPGLVELVQATLSAWANATGGPRITVTVSD